MRRFNQGEAELALKFRTGTVSDLQKNADEHRTFVWQDYSGTQKLDSCRGPLQRFLIGTCAQAPHLPNGLYQMAILKHKDMMTKSLMTQAKRLRENSKSVKLKCMGPAEGGIGSEVLFLTT
jgi:hypothetical protein